MTENATEWAKMQTIRLDVEKAGAALALSPEIIMSGPSGSAVASPLIRHWTLAFSKTFPAYTLGNYRWPATWWDAVKARWFPAWMERKWPVMWDGIDLKQAFEARLEVGQKYVYFVRTTGGDVVHLQEDEQAAWLRWPVLCPKCGEMTLFWEEHLREKPKGVSC